MREPKPTRRLPVLAAVTLALVFSVASRAGAENRPSGKLDAEMLAEIELLSDEHFDDHRSGVGRAKRGRVESADDFDWLDLEDADHRGEEREK